MSARVRIRWWPGAVIVGLVTVAYLVVYHLEKFIPEVWAYAQSRNLVLLGLMGGGVLALLIWWLFFSRASMRARLAGLALAALPFVFYRWSVSGDFVSIFTPRFWGKKQYHVTHALKDAGEARPDFAQFLGPDRDGHLAGPVLDPDWAAHPPQVVWKKSVGPAWSGFAVAGGRAVTQEERDGQEWVVCSDLATGNEQWRTANPGQYSDSLAGVGPRATPTIVDGRVYTLGSTGALRCLDLASGQPIWTRDVAADASIAMPKWGFSSSPLVHDGKVIVSAGGRNNQSLLAYRASDGQVAWGAGSHEISYSSPALRTIAGRAQVLIFNADSLLSHDPATGAVLWEYPWPSARPNVALPVVAGDRVIVSTGYAYGTELLVVTAGAEGKMDVTRQWKSARFQAKFSNPIERGGYLYGVSDGDFACLNLRDGSRKWKGTHYGHGQALMVGEFFLQVAEEEGDLVLLRPTPEAPNELATFKVFDAKTWNPLALSGDLLLMRNDREAICLRLPVKR